MEQKEIDLKVQEAASEGKLACGKAFLLAKESAISLKEIGEAADRQGIKIVHCQLGCFD